MVGVALDVDDRCLGVLRLVAQRIDEDATGHRAIRTSVACLRRLLEPEGTDAGGERIARVDKAQCSDGRRGQSGRADLHELPACHRLHVPLRCTARILSMRFSYVSRIVKSPRWKKSISILQLICIFKFCCAGSE